MSADDQTRAVEQFARAQGYDVEKWRQLGLLDDIVRSALESLREQGVDPKLLEAAMAPTDVPAESSERISEALRGSFSTFWAPERPAGPDSPRRGAERPADAPTVAAVPIAPPGVAWTLSEAAERCRVHRSTLRRALDDGRFPNAYREPDDGPWRVPLADLQAAGYPPSPLGAADSLRTADRDTDDQAEHQRLQRELADLRAALQHERDAHQRTQELFAQAMRALSPGVSPAPVAEHEPPQSQPVVEPRRTWWRRVRGV